MTTKEKEEVASANMDRIEHLYRYDGEFARAVNGFLTSSSSPDN
jgi:hypothetical protein